MLKLIILSIKNKTKNITFRMKDTNKKIIGIKKGYKKYIYLQ